MLETLGKVIYSIQDMRTHEFFWTGGNIMKKFNCSLLKSLRKEAMITQLTLASIVDSDARTISRWENLETANPNIETLKKVVDYFNSIGLGRTIDINDFSLEESKDNNANSKSELSRLKEILTEALKIVENL